MKAVIDEIEQTEHAIAVVEETGTAIEELSEAEQAIQPRNAEYAIRQAQREEERQLELFLEDKGHWPSRYRAYPHEDWLRLFDAIEEMVAAVPADYQRRIGVYVEERSDEFLLLKAKRWQLAIRAPKKSTAAGKSFKLSDIPPVVYVWPTPDHRLAFADFLYEHAKGDDRDLLLDIASQYEPHVRARLNRRQYNDQNGGEAAE